MRSYMGSRVVCAQGVHWGIDGEEMRKDEVNHGRDEVFHERREGIRHGEGEMTM